MLSLLDNRNALFDYEGSELMKINTHDQSYFEALFL